jgi:hypothetical protein
MNKQTLPVALLLLAGALHWAVFLGPTSRPWAGPAFSVEDWPKEYRYYEVLQQAVREGRVPLYISRPIHTRKFLALPETLWSPQVALLGVLGVGPFVVVNTLLLYAAGCVGLLRLRRRYDLSLPAFAFLFLAFMLNGHITAHLAVGHSMWAGYFLLPLFALPLLDLVERRATRATPLLIALALFAILLQGALHVFVWCLMLLGLLGLFSFALLPAVWRALAWTAGLAVCRLAPAFFLMNRKDQAFLSGIPSWSALWHGLLTVRDPRQALEGGRFGTLAWWELDFHLGAVGVVVLVVFGLLLRFRGRDRAQWRRPGLDGALLVLALLAAGDVYWLVNRLPLPLLSAQRVSSRFLVLPLVFLTILAAARLEQWLREVHPVLSRVALVAVALFAASLGTHSAVWRVSRLEQILPARRGNLEMSIAPREDVPDGRMEQAYRATVPLAAALSLGTLVALGLRLRRLRAEPPEDVAPTTQSPPAPPNTEG